jgi:hypothetical protein
MLSGSLWEGEVSDDAASEDPTTEKVDKNIQTFAAEKFLCFKGSKIARPAERRTELCQAGSPKDSTDRAADAFPIAPLSNCRVRNRRKRPSLLLGGYLSDAKLNATGRDFCQIWCD